MSMLNLSPKQLRQAADLQERIQELKKQLEAVIAGGEMPVALASEPSAENGGRRKRRKMSRAGLPNRGAAQETGRAAKLGLGAAAEPKGFPNVPKRKISLAGRAAMAAAATARWAKARGENGTGQAEPKRGRNISPALRKARSQAMKARWAAKKAAGKTSL